MNKVNDSQQSCLGMYFDPSWKDCNCLIWMELDLSQTLKVDNCLSMFALLHPKVVYIILNHQMTINVENLAGYCALEIIQVFGLTSKRLRFLID